MGFIVDSIRYAFYQASLPFRSLSLTFSRQPVAHKELKQLFTYMEMLAGDAKDRCPNTIVFQNLKQFSPHNNLPLCTIGAIVRPDVKQFNIQNPYSPEKNIPHALRFDIFSDPSTENYTNAANSHYRVVMYSYPTPYKQNDGQSEQDITPEPVVSKATLSIRDIKSLMANLPTILISDLNGNKSLIETTFRSILSSPQRLTDYSGFSFQVIDAPQPPEEPEPR